MPRSAFQVQTPTFGGVLLLWNFYLGAGGIAMSDEPARCRLVLRGHGRGPTAWITSVAFSPCGAILASASHSSRIKLWSTTTGADLGTLDGGDKSATTFVRFSSNGKTLASAHGTGVVRLWDVSTKNKTATLKSALDLTDISRISVEPLIGQDLARLGHLGSVLSVSFTPDGKALVATGSDGAIKVWDLPSGNVVRTLVGGRPASTFALAPNGLTLGIGCADGTVEFWDMQTSRRQWSLAAHSNGYKVTSVAFSPDCTTLATAVGKEWYSGAPGEVKLWDVGSAKQLAVLLGHKGAVMSVAFSPERRMIASGSEDKTIILWDISTAAPIVTLKGHSQPVSCVAFAHDARNLASGSADGTVRLWSIE